MAFEGATTPPPEEEPEEQNEEPEAIESEISKHEPDQALDDEDCEAVVVSECTY